MSQYFSIGDQDLWNPASRVGQLFYRTAGVMAQLVDTPHGLHDTEQDEYQVDPVQFMAFVDALARCHLSSTHTALRTLISGFLATAVVLTERAGLAVPALTEPVVAKPRDHSCTTERPDVSGDIVALFARSRELDRTMAR
ncbi:DUF6086 family protein [Catellatospora vulcania]|uniref:DUF6086 family protein n=1 Tax=Catellatospora vulcania TaxID=1460450 RepID=UPI0012D38223|nr:DUF6086 family protein [Catellatospora vulcania]